MKVLLTDHRKYQELSQNCVTFYERNYTTKAVVPKYLELLANVG